MQLTINSSESLSNALGVIREEWKSSKYLKVTIKSGKGRSISQNDLSHAWYEQLARELKEDDALGWKSYCKLHCGIPILRAEDEEFRDIYDGSLKHLSYEQKLKAMHHLLVTSLMTKPQLTKYLEAMQSYFLPLGVMLNFPETQFDEGRQYEKAQ